MTRSAERIIDGEKWRICRERAAARLASTASLNRTRLFPDSTVLQVAAMDGLVIGQVRQNGRRRIATGVGQRRRVAHYDSVSRVRAGPRAPTRRGGSQSMTPTSNHNQGRGKRFDADIS